MSDQPGPPCSWCDQRHDVRYLCDPAKAILDALYQRGARGNMPTLEFPDPIPAAQFYGDLGLGPDARVLSQLVVALIVRRPGEPDREYQWFVDDLDLDLGNADPFALKIGRPFPDTLPPSEADVLRQVEPLTRGAHLVGCVPNFDAEVIAARMRAHGLLPSWHYHLIDVETLAVGCLAAKRVAMSLPWDSEALAWAVGVDPLVDIYDAVMADPQPPVGKTV